MPCPRGLHFLGSHSSIPDCFADAKNTRDLIARLARTKPGTLACMHGSAFRGDRERLLLELGRTLTG